MKFNACKWILVILLLVMCSIRPVSAHGVLYETKPLGENKIRIMIKWSSPEEAQGIVISYYSLKNGKTLTIGYQIQKDAPVSAYLDYDLKGTVPPVRIILSRVGDINWTPFPDIRGIEAEEYIRHLHDSGIINGRPDGTYKPFDRITRAEFVTLMVKALKLQDNAEDDSVFSDIEGSFAKKHIMTAARHGLISGYPDKTFHPDDPITVAQVCKIISNSFKFKTTGNGIYSKLKQDKWYSSYVRKMFDTGILSVDDSIYENFDEESSINRADAAILISRALTTY